MPVKHAFADFSMPEALQCCCPTAGIMVIITPDDVSKPRPLNRSKHRE